MNSILQSNPYGILDVADLEAFEARIGCRLPDEYRRYLLAHNGGEYEKIIFPGEPSFTMHHVLGLHNGPDYYRLERRFPLWETCDLEDVKEQLERLLFIADTTTGDAILLNCDDGSIWFFDPHDVTGEPDQNLKEDMICLASNFDAFIEQLVSDAEYDQLMSGDPVYEDFKQRLRLAKEQRAREVGEK